MSGTSDADTSSDSGSLDALSSYHYDVSYIIVCSCDSKKKDRKAYTKAFLARKWNKK